MAADPDSKVAIYALSDSDGVVRYIGKSTNPDARLRQHITSSKNPRTPVHCWISREVAEGRKVVLGVVAWIDEAFWPETERAVIAGLRPYGRLLNLADGGDQPQRSDDPAAKRRWYVKNQLRRALKDEAVSDSCKDHLRAKMRMAAAEAPHWFGEWAAL